MNYKTNNNVVYSCKYHVVWCTKYLRKILRGEAAERLKGLIHTVVQEHSAELIELEIMPDHVDLLVEVGPQYGIHRLIKQIKGQTSRILKLPGFSSKNFLESNPESPPCGRILISFQR